MYLSVGILVDMIEPVFAVGGRTDEDMLLVGVGGRRGCLVRSSLLLLLLR